MDNPISSTQISVSTDYKHRQITTFDEDEYIDDNNNTSNNRIIDDHDDDNTERIMKPKTNMNSTLHQRKRNNRICRSLFGRWTNCVIGLGGCLLLILLASWLIGDTKNTNNIPITQDDTNVVVDNNVSISPVVNESTSFYIKSSAFGYGEPIPSKYAGIISPPLQWSNAPEGTKSFVLLMNDPDAPDPANPQTVWIHWLVYDIPSNITSFDEGQQQQQQHSSSSRSSTGIVARNDWEKIQYDGPSPPIGKHRYYIKLYALDTIFGDLGPDAEWEIIEDRVNEHLLDETEYMGTYEKPKP